MYQKALSLAKSDFIKHNAIFFVGALGVGLLNYLLYPAISRFLTVQEFGEVQVLVNLLVQITVFANVVSLFVVNIITNMHDAKKEREFIESIESIVILMSIAIAGVIALASPLMAKWLQYDSYSAFLQIGIILVINVPISIRLGYLRAKKQFGINSIAQILQSGLKLVIGTALSIIGFGVSGVMFSLTASLALALFYVHHKTSRQGLTVRPFAHVRRIRLDLIKAQVKTLQGTGRYMLLISVVSFSTLFLLSFDTVLAKYFYDPDTAGLYGGLSVVSRVLFFITSSVASVLASTIQVNDALRVKVQNLLLTMIATVLMSGVVTLIFAWQPETVVRIMLGNQYVASAYLLPKLGIATFLISLINVFYTYHTAVRDVGIIAPSSVGVAITTILVCINHDTIERLVNSLLTGIMTMLFLIAVWSVYWHIVERNKQAGRQLTSPQP